MDNSYLAHAQGDGHQRNAISGFDYIEHEPSDHVQIRKTSSNTLEVSVRLPPAERADSLVHTWECPPAEMERISAVLGVLRGAKASPVAQYTLSITRQGAPPLHLVWTSQDETHDLAAARKTLEQAGHLPYLKAVSWQKRAQSLGESKQASEAWQKGVDALGSTYYDPSTVDDTGMKLTLANARARAGDYQAATSMYSRNLETRLALYRQTHHLDQEKSSHTPAGSH